MFFTYRQNNSGGSWIRNEDVNIYVIVEADTSEESDMLAQRYGIYFEGCNKGMDCPCCGDRWSEQWWASRQSAEPSIYSVPVESEDVVFTPAHDVIIYRKDGTKTFSVSV